MTNDELFDMKELYGCLRFIIETGQLYNHEDEFCGCNGCMIDRISKRIGKKYNFHNEV